MQVLFEKDPKEFLKKHSSYLSAHEVEHNLIFSLCSGAEKKISAGQKCDIRFSTLSNDDGLVVAAVQSPPHNLVLSRASQPDIEALAEKLAAEKQTFPGIVGPSDVAASFANRWTSITGDRAVEYMDQIIYSLKDVLMPPPVEGVFRFAKPEEAPLIAEWIAAFAVQTLPKTEHLTPENAKKTAEERIRDGRIAIWAVEGKPVAQAGISGTDKIARIGMVYTPPGQRGQGYASAIVAHLSQHMLEKGCKMCCLYADARNPVSNSIYRKIGYEFVSRSSLYVLGKPAAKA
jgi:predicted GNAT family acetyltransferase